MGAKSTYLDNALLDQVLRNVTYTPPATVYLALYTADPGNGNTGTEVSTTSTGYARQAVTFAAASAGSVASNATVTYPQATGAWGTVGYWGICDAVSGGNLLYHGSLPVAKVPTSGDTFSVASGNITITES